MPLDPITLSALIAGGLSGVGSAIGGSLAGEDAKPFRNIPVGDRTFTPTQLLGSGLEGTARLGQFLTGRAEEDIALSSALVGPPEGLAGFAIPGFGTIPGPAGRDPAHANPDLLVNRGRDLGDPFAFLGEGTGGGLPTQPPPGDGPDDEDPMGDPTPSDLNPLAGGAGLTASLQQILGSELGPSQSLFSPQDADQGLAAVDLLRTVRSG